MKRLINIIRQRFACSSSCPRPSCHTLSRCLFYRHILDNSETLADGRNSYKSDILQICSSHTDQTLPSLRSTPCFRLASGRRSLWCFSPRPSTYREWSRCRASSHTSRTPWLPLTTPAAFRARPGADELLSPPLPVAGRPRAQDAGCRGQAAVGCQPAPRRRRAAYSRRAGFLHGRVLGSGDAPGLAVCLCALCRHP